MALTWSGASGTRNVPTGDQAVTAAVPAVSITPWKERTRQNFAPAVGSWATVYVGPFRNGMSCSICVKPESRAICSEADAPPVGETSVGAAAIGASNAIVKPITFDGML